ncbi:MAG: sporulation protein [Chloroflexota bacterium]|nr:sporulation protein [Chloroflexota bacterium]
MGLGGIMDSGGEWALEIEGGADRAVPGGSLRGTAHFTASRRIEARSVTASLVAREAYAYEVTERDARGDSRIDRDWESSDAWRQDLPLQGPMVMEDGSRHSFPLAFDLPADALPSFESGILRLTWRLSVAIDASGRDPSVERDIHVPLTEQAPQAGDATALMERFAGSADGTPFAILLDPRPLVPGGAFRGAIETSEQLDPARTRLEIKLLISTDYSSGGFDVGIDLPGGVRMESRARRAVSEQRAIWKGQLTGSEAADGVRRYPFAGQLPDDPVATLVLPHGSSRAIVDVIVDRRMRPDRHLSRPVAIGRS